MIFDPPLQQATILKRYKRFLADIKLADKTIITAHCPNTGSMKNCWQENTNCAISHNPNPKRKYAYTLEMTTHFNQWVGINTARTNNLVAEALENKKIEEFRNIDQWQREVKVGSSRIDFLLNQTYLEVKNVTLIENDLPQLALFPDAVSERGSKHLEELTQIVRQGGSAAMLFVVQRENVNLFSPAKIIDPIYTKNLIYAYESGVQILVYKCNLSLNQIVIDQKIPFKF